jgi:hypothetical protein
VLEGDDESHASQQNVVKRSAAILVRIDIDTGVVKRMAGSFQRYSKDSRLQDKAYKCHMRPNSWLIGYLQPARRLDTFREM